jgi:arsenate reductase (thioredoxin)
MTAVSETAKTVLYVCVHNAGRSQMAEAFTNVLGGGKVQGVSAGTEPGERVNPVALEAMREIGIDMNGQRPRLLTREMLDTADRAITMGCGVAESCPALLGGPMEDWGLDDPAGQPIEKVREIRDQIRERVEKLLDKLG